MSGDWNLFKYTNVLFVAPASISGASVDVTMVDGRRQEKDCCNLFGAWIPIYSRDFPLFAFLLVLFEACF